MSFSGSNREESTTTCAKEWWVMMISDRIKRELFEEFLNARGRSFIKQQSFK
jgi:hypothetical protein